MRLPDSAIGGTKRPAEAVTCCLLAILLLGGCGRDSRLVPASGMVRFSDGRRVLAGTIEVAPLGAGRPARASLSDEGRFTLLTAGREGVFPGPYRVVVLPMLVIGHPPHGPVVDPRFTSYETSGLTLEVPPAGSRDIVIEVDPRR